jgi:hypothetical protein
MVNPGAVLFLIWTIVAFIVVAAILTKEEE